MYVGRLPIEGVRKLTGIGVRRLSIRDVDNGLLASNVGRVPMDIPRRVPSGIVGGLPIDDIVELPI